MPRSRGRRKAKDRPVLFRFDVARPPACILGPARGGLDSGRRPLYGGKPLSHGKCHGGHVRPRLRHPVRRAGRAGVRCRADRGPAARGHLRAAHDQRAGVLVPPGLQPGDRQGHRALCRPGDGGAERPDRAPPQPEAGHPRPAAAGLDPEAGGISGSGRLHRRGDRRHGPGRRVPPAGLPGRHRRLPVLLGAAGRAPAGGGDADRGRRHRPVPRHRRRDRRGGRAAPGAAEGGGCELRADTVPEVADAEQRPAQQRAATGSSC